MPKVMIEVHGIQKRFGQEQVLREIDFQLPAASTLSLLGKSGCGKTTLLKILAGLETGDGGSFKIDGQEMLQTPPQQRGVVYLSQEPLLFPHMDVFENIAFGLRIRGMQQQAIQQRVEQLLQQLGLEAQARKAPQALSGGQKQRAAFGRAIVIHPKILLLDEPFGSLDAETRAEMQVLFQALRKSEQITSLFVTHDLREAITMGDQFGKMAQGKIKIFADLQEFLAEPDANVQNELAFWKKLNEIE
jgi:ABC-type sugar transport system ATPase subunit